MSFPDTLTRFRTEYKGPKIALFITGGGYSLFDLMKFPGASRFFYGGVSPYAVSSFDDILCTGDDPLYGKCSEEASQLYYNDSISSGWIDDDDVNEANVVVVNAALTTNRYRMGNNKCHCVINGDHHFFELERWPEHLYHSKTPAEIDAKRLSEDQEVAAKILTLLLEKYNA